MVDEVDLVPDGALCFVRGPDFVGSTISVLICVWISI